MTNAKLTDLVTTLFRVVLGLLFALHGAASLFGIFGGNRGSGEAIPLGTWPDGTPPSSSSWAGCSCWSA